MDVAALSFRFVLGSIFLLAGASKLFRRADFADAVRRYKLLPDAATTVLAEMLPPAEVAGGALLLAGLALPVAAAVLAALLLLFAGAVAINLFRGRRIDCGCFSVAAPRRITWATVARNVVFAAFAVFVAIRPPRAFSIDGLILGGQGRISSADATAVLVIVALALAAASILVEGLRFRRLVGGART